MSKKGDLSINIIIIAAIALIILVILSVLLFQSGGLLRKGTSCQGLSGYCVPEDEYTSCDDYAETSGISENLNRNFGAACASKEEFCCTPTGK